jgi:hypothetical protein
MRWYGAAAFGVPVAVLLFSLAGYWVLAGFKAPRRT